MKNKGNKGFTLIEVLVVIGIIAILAAIVVVAVNPARQFAQANNSQRWSNVNAILNAVHQYAVEHKGQLPDGIDGTVRDICITGVATCASPAVDLSAKLVPTYVVAMPTDPTGVSETLTGYQISTTTENRIRVSAPSQELGESISVER